MLEKIELLLLSLQTRHTGVHAGQGQSGLFPLPGVWVSEDNWLLDHSYRPGDYSLPNPNGAVKDLAS